MPPPLLDPDEQSPVRPPVDGVLGAIGNTPLVALASLPRRPADRASGRSSRPPTPAAASRTAPPRGWSRDALEDGSDRARRDGHRVELGQHGRRARAGLPLPRPAAHLRRRHPRARGERADAARARGRRARRLRRPIPRRAICSRPASKLVAQLLATTPGAFWPNQYANPSNPAAHAAGHDARDRRGAGRRPRLRLRRDEHGRHAARVLATTCARTAARRGSSPSTPSAARCSAASGRRARAARLRRRRRDRRSRDRRVFDRLVRVARPRLRRRLPAARRARGDLRRRLLRRGRRGAARRWRPRCRPAVAAR